MKKHLLIPFLAILLTVFVVSFISKQEKNTDESLFREYLNGFKQAKFPLEVTAKIATFNPQRTIPKKFDRFLSDGMKPYPMSRIPSRYHNEYAYKIAENDSIVVVICGSISVPEVVEYQKKHTGRTKWIIIYDRKGNIVDEINIAYNESGHYGTGIISADLICNRQVYKKNKDNKGAKIAEIGVYSVGLSGKISTIKEDIYTPRDTVKDSDYLKP